MGLGTRLPLRGRISNLKKKKKRTHSTFGTTITNEHELCGVMGGVLMQIPPLKKQFKEMSLTL